MHEDVYVHQYHCLIAASIMFVVEVNYDRPPRYSDSERPLGRYVLRMFFLYKLIFIRRTFSDVVPATFSKLFYAVCLRLQ